MAVPKKSRNVLESLQGKGNGMPELGLSLCQTNIIGHFICPFILCLVWVFWRIWGEGTCDSMKLNLQSTHLTINSLGIQILCKNDSRQDVSIVWGGSNSKIV